MPEVLVTGRPSLERRAPFAGSLVAIPLRTRLVDRGDDLAALVAAAVNGIALPSDVICVSETALAIAQGRLISAETIRPSRLAYILSRRAGAMATVNQPESLQLVIDEVGPWKVAYAALAHVAGRLIGRRGVFYEILGGAIAAIDGYTGTLPPFEHTIVLGPQDPDGAAESMAARAGAHVAIVDANDLGIAKVLGASRGVARARVERALLTNPHGNADEQTPIVVLKWRGAEANPLLEDAA
jgi:F420-0:gamma-glutamyl ligase